MKKLALFAVALLASAVSFAALNPFAYGLSSKLSADETTLTVNYSLNATATAVSVVILDGETIVKTVDCADKGLTKGAYEVEIPTTDLPKTKSLTWKVEVKGESVATPTIQSDLTLSYCLPRGIGIDRSPESPYFGRIYTTEATPGGNAYHSKEGRGLYAFDPTITPIKNSKGGYVFTGGITYNSDDISRVVVAGDGRVFLSRFNTTGSPVLEVNPANLDENFTNVFSSITGSAVGIDVKGAGENLRLVMLSKSTWVITEYDLGTSTQYTSSTPSRTYTKKDLTTEKALSLVTNNAYISYDKENGIWLTQHRATATTTEPTIAHVIPSGVDYNNFNEGLSHNGTSNGGIAISPDGKLLAVVGAGTKKLTIFDVSRDNGEIKLTSKYTISTAGDNHTALTWDYAGNLYVANRSAETITFYAMPYSGQVSTPCASKYAFQLQEEVVGTFYTVTANANDPAMGEITGNDGQYTAGTTATLTAEPAIGYQFVNWTVGEETKTENPLILTVNSDLTVTANFVALPQYTITATANDIAMGSVTGAGTYYEGEEVTLIATANEGHAFVDWSNGATTPTLTFVAEKDTTVTANFNILSYTLTVNVNDETRGSVDFTTGTYEYGTEVKVTATPEDGYEFAGWSNESKANPLTITVKKDETITANFRAILASSITLNALPVQDYSASIVGTVKRAIQNGENTIVLSHEDNGAPHIYNVAHATKTVTEISQEGVNAAADGFLAISDIAVTEDDKLVACNYVHCTFTPSNTSYFYIWNDLAAAPSVWFTSQKSGNYNDAYMGYTMALKGTSQNAEVTISAFNKSNSNTRYSHLYVVDGTYSDASYKYSRDNAALHPNTLGKNTYELNASPLAAGKWILDGELTSPIEFVEKNAVAIDTYTALNSDVLGKKYNGATYLANYNEHHLMVAPYANGEGYLAGVKVVDIVDGFAAATELTTNTDLATAENATVAAATAVVDAEGKLTIHLFSDAKVYTFTQKEQGPATAVDNTTVAPQVQKIVRDGQVLIIRDGKTFNMMGQEVR